MIILELLGGLLVAGILVLGLFQAARYFKSKEKPE